MKISFWRLFLLIAMQFAASCHSTNTKDNKEAGKLPFYNQPDFTPQWISPSDTAYSSIHTIPSFQFLNQDGVTVTDETVAGKIYIANFFFTTCPGICKRLTAQISAVQAAFLNDANVLILSHSVTPDNDSVPRLKQYAADYGVISNKWFLLTGNRTAIYNIARKAYFADEDMGEQKTSNDFLHTENVLLIDRYRRIRGVYKGTSAKEIQDLIGDIKLLEKEE
jgi:protein SCO1/2